MRSLSVMCSVLLHSALGFEAHAHLHTPTDQSTLRPRADHKAAARTTHMQGVSTPVLRQALSAPRPLIKRNPWGFTYANVRPLRENSIESLIFLGTNVAFFVAGACIESAGNPALGLLAELAGTASIGYHWAQVKYGGTNRPVVQSLLLIDYALALPTFFFGILYAMQLGSALPLSAVIKAIAACAFFGGAICVKGPRAYMVLHGMWHILGALAGRDLALAMATMAQ